MITDEMGETDVKIKYACNGVPMWILSDSKGFTQIWNPSLFKSDSNSSSFWRNLVINMLHSIWTYVNSYALHVCLFYDGCECVMSKKTECYVEFPYS